MKRILATAGAVIALTLGLGAMPAQAAWTPPVPNAPAGSVATIDYRWYPSAEPADKNVWRLLSASSEVQNIHVKMSNSVVAGVEQFIEQDIALQPGASWTLSSPRSATAYVDVSLIDDPTAPVSRTLASKYDLAADGKTYINITDPTDKVRNKTGEPYLFGAVYPVLP